jgi:anti-sigma regulatory factor (Ser/Thr protein kinase)
VPVLRHHAGTGEPALVIVGPHTEHILRNRLGSTADAVEWGRTDAFYQRLGFAFETFRRYLRRQHARGRSVHVIAEPDIPTDLEAPVDRVAAYLPYEASCNDAYAGYGCPVTCIWDSRRHPTLVIEGVRSIHDHELTEEGKRRNTSFIPTHDYLSGRADVAMPPAPVDADLDFTVSDLDHLGECRAAIGGWATRHGFTEDATGQVKVATTEALTNGLQHGRPPVRLRAWHHDTTLVTQVDDHGARPIPPHAGYRPPVHTSSRVGLWVARQFADVVLTRTTTHLTTVRLYFPHALTHRHPAGR